MEKTVHCKCKSGCENRRCVCLRNKEPCDEECKCVDCENPLNGMDVRETPSNNDSALPLAEVVEGRGLAKGNSAKQTRVWTQCLAALQHANSRIRQMVKRDEGYADPHTSYSA